MKTSRSAAIDAGERYYKTGKPCINGHTSKRSTIDGSCIECRSEYQKAKRIEIKEKLNANGG